MCSEFKKSLFSDPRENVICTTRPQGEPICKISGRSLQYFLRNSDNKLSMSKSKMAAWRPYLFSDPRENVICTTRPQGEPICKISGRSLRYFLRNSDNKNCLRTDDGRLTTDDGRRTTDDGRRTTDDGRTDHGRRVI